MPKQKDLGRALIKNRFGNVNNNSNKNTKSLTSFTEENTIDEFLNEHEMTNTEFPAEKLRILTVNDVLPSKEEVTKNIQVQKMHIDKLRIPRRPVWDANTTADELTEKENKSFLEWRHSLSLLTEIEGIVITPYEKNLEFWRQLWRVIEKSDVVVQIVDARNPLLFRCKDLEDYVSSVGKKSNCLLINKADFLSVKQRTMWYEYFKSIDVKVLFFSALKEIDRIKEGEGIKPNNEDAHTKILTSPELLNALCDVGLELKEKQELVVVGLIGYPNVGKSSTLNALLCCKETEKNKHYQASVSSTPGKTKHFQTFYINEHLLLADCPGLVMPNFVSTKAEMVTNGILPIDQARDYVQPTAVVCNNIPSIVLENLYGIMLPIPEGDQETELNKAYTLLGLYARVRGFMSQKGVPDLSRAARVILKDYVNGKLLYCYPPPGIEEKDFKEESSIPLVKKIPAPKQVLI